MATGRQFSTYLAGDLARQLEECASEMGLSPYALLARIATEFLVGRSEVRRPARTRVGENLRIVNRDVSDRG